MAIDVKQLTINSTIQRDDDDTNKDKKDEKDKEESENKKKGSVGGGGDCFDPDVLKAEILAECKRMIRRVPEYQRSR